MSDRNTPIAVDRQLVPVKKIEPPAVSGPLVDQSENVLVGLGTGKRLRSVDVRFLSPRQMTETSLDLYVIGAIGWDEHALLSFQAELHPDFNSTIGALTGETAQPDRERDFLEEWEKRLQFERRHNFGNAKRIRNIDHIVNVLRQLDAPIDLSV
ncbi:MAG: hypothetical protein HQ504_00835 [Rhodospirillaceae bacterium]|nr:hypothetical protein [Rhodospirillaceae bacterium]